MDWIKFGKKMREARESRGLSQKDIARLLGVSDAFISQVENGKKKMNTDNLIKISISLEKSLIYCI